MPRLGGKTSTKETESGRMSFGDKDATYLEQVSRQSVEEHLDLPLIYFALDWDNSKRNFYGELLMKKFKNIKGTPVKAKYLVKEGEMAAPIPNQMLELNVTIFVEQLKELNIDPKLDDFFALGQRLYCIYKRSINESGATGTLMVDRKRIEAHFFCRQEDDEILQADIWGNNLGLEYQINSHKGDITKK